MDDFAPGNAGRANRQTIAIAVVVALLAALIIWWPTQSWALAGGFAAAAVVALGIAAMLPRRVSPSNTTMLAGTGNDPLMLRAVADSCSEAIAVTDRHGHLVSANAAFLDWFGGAVTPPNLPAAPDVIRHLVEAGRNAWAQGEAAIAAFRIDNAEFTGAIRRIGRGDDHLLWQWQRQEAEDRGAASGAAWLNGPMAQALSEAGVMAVLTSPTGTIRASNAAFNVRSVGDAATDMAGRDFAALLWVDGGGLIRFVRERTTTGATPLRILEIPIERDDPGSDLLMLLIDEDGGGAERGIAIEYVEALLGSLPFGMATVDRDGRFLFVNPTFLTLGGFADGEVPRYPGDLVVSDDKGALAEAIRRHAGARRASTDLTVRLKGQPDTPVVLGLASMRGMGDAAVLLSLRGESHQENDLKQQVAQAQKMQAVGQLAGGIAHDFNNILTGVLGSCDLMLLRHTPGDSDYDDIQQIRSNANRAANLTRQLLAFSRQQTLRPQIINLSDIVADVSHLLQRLLGERIQLDVRHGRGLGSVRADPVQLEQVIVNLAVNGRDAMPSGGRLEIETRQATPADLTALGEEIIPAGDYVLLAVRDTGTGIAPDVLPKIFDPFFTTKETGKGTGLGLATVYGIVKQSGGFIFARSEMGRGTEFLILLPVHQGSGEERAVRVEPPQPTRAAQWGTGKILLVEDEDVVRTIAERALVRAGYTVVTAIHGADGLTRMAGARDIDLVISDVMMPEMDGPTMAARIRETRPDIPVLFMSGYAEEQLRQSIALANVGFLPKPFSVNQLLEAVEAIRAASGPA